MTIARKKTLIGIGILIGSMSFVSIYGAIEKSTSIQVKTDPRIELMSIIFRMAGNPEYRMGQIFYDKTRTVLTIPVELKPDTHYEFGLNEDGYFAFATETGDPLYPAVIRFKTGKAGKIRGSQSLLILSRCF